MYFTGKLRRGRVRKWTLNFSNSTTRWLNLQKLPWWTVTKYLLLASPAKHAGVSGGKKNDPENKRRAPQTAGPLTFRWHFVPRWHFARHTSRQSSRSRPSRPHVRAHVLRRGFPRARRGCPTSIVSSSPTSSLSRGSSYIHQGSAPAERSGPADCPRKLCGCRGAEGG